MAMNPTITLLKLQLHNFIRSMYDEGIVNEQFLHLQAWRQPLFRDSLFKAVIRYCVSCKSIFTSLTDQIEGQQNVDFAKVNEIARDFYTRTCSIGAESVRCACAELIHASEKKDKDSCSLALYWTKHRFSDSKIKFESFVKMERNIIFLEDSQ